MAREIFYRNEGKKKRKPDETERRLKTAQNRLFDKNEQNSNEQRAVKVDGMEEVVVNSKQVSALRLYCPVGFGSFSFRRIYAKEMSPSEKWEYLADISGLFSSV